VTFAYRVHGIFYLPASPPPRPCMLVDCPRLLRAPSVCAGCAKAARVARPRPAPTAALQGAGCGQCGSRRTVPRACAHPPADGCVPRRQRAGAPAPIAWPPSLPAWGHSCSMVTSYHA
jgi:hypothetical protein